MDFAAAEFDDSDLLQLENLDHLDQLWKGGAGSASNSKTSITSGSHPTGHNMADQNGANNTQAVDLEATPDLELKIRIIYADNQVKNMEGSLNPTRTIGQLKARLSAQLNMQPHLVEMSWSKRHNNGEQANPVILDNDNNNLMTYNVETDDTIILRELLGN